MNAWWRPLLAAIHHLRWLHVGFLLIFFILFYTTVVSLQRLDDNYAHEAQWVRQLRLARLDLSLGYVHLLNPEVAEDGFDAVYGRTLLNQALRSLRAAAPNSPLAPSLSQQLTAAVERLQVQLDDLPRPPDDLARLRLHLVFTELERVAARAQAELDVRQEVARGQRQSGTYLGVWLLAGLLLGVVCLLLLLRERQRVANTALAASEERAQAIADYTANLEVWLDARGHWQWINPAAADFTGYPICELSQWADPFGRIVHPEDLPALRRHVEETLGGRPTDPIDFRLCRRDQQIRWVRAVSRPLYSRQGHCLGLRTSGTDITALCLAQSRLEQTTAELRATADRAVAADRAKMEFLSVMSHELRTPLTPITGFAELLLNESLTDEQRQMVQYILNGAIRQKALVENVLQYTRLDRNTLRPNPQPFVLGELLQQLVGAMKPKAAHVQLGLEVPPSLASLVCLGDSLLLAQLVTLLLDNALKYAPSGSVRVRVEGQRDLAAKEPGVALQIQVVDTGIGIAADDLVRIFEPFVQVDSSVRRPFEGAGLGLSIASKLAAVLGARLTVQSTLGAGSTFAVLIRLPVLEEPAAPRVESARPQPVGHGRRVLVVDDQPENGQLALAVLQRLGAYPRMETDPKRAFALCLAEAFDLILVDLFMPELNGQEFAQQLQQQPGPNQKTCLVAFTADAHAVTETSYRALGFHAMLIKPVRLQDFIQFFEKLNREARVVSVP